MKKGCVPFITCSAGSYEVRARWTQHPNRATNAKYTVNHAGGATVVTMNQEAGGGSWQLLGTFSFNAGTTTVSLSDEANDYVIADAVMLVVPGAAPNTATWALNVPASGSYDVYARWTQHPNRATDAKYTVNHAGGATQVTVNQEAGGGTWHLLGNFSFNAGTATVSLTDQANGFVIADAVMLAPPGAAPNAATWAMPQGEYQVYARWTQHANRATNATYTLSHMGGSSPVSVNQQLNGGVWNLLGTYTFAAGHNVRLTDQANGYVVADAIRVVPTPGQPSGPAGVFYVHTDHLDTPRVISNGMSQLVWRWDQADPFGGNVPNENPSGLGTFVCNLRLPGQYFDKETNLHYNYFRDYDPAIGRYVQSDPVGLSGGINTYLYALANPLSLIDPDGLRAVIQCLRCRDTAGPLSCSVDEDGVPGNSFNTNMGTNSPSLTQGDPYGTNGPLPPGSFDVLNAPSPAFGRVLPSPTNTGRPGQVVTPAGTVREGIRIHQGTFSQGCLTTGSGQGGADVERYIRELVNRNRNTGGTSLIIQEQNCGCNTNPPTCR